MQSIEDNTKTQGVNLALMREVIAPILVAHGVALVDLEWLTDRAGWTLRVTIERPDSNEAGGGVTLEDCAEVSRAISAELDLNDPIPQHYQLEVSSPGLDRKLLGEADFVRFQGRTARIKLKNPAKDGQTLLRGQIEEVSRGVIAVVVDGKRLEAPVEDVAEARLVFELATQPKKSGPGTKKPKGIGQGRRRPSP